MAVIDVSCSVPRLFLFLMLDALCLLCLDDVFSGVIFDSTVFFYSLVLAFKSAAFPSLSSVDRFY
jgi:hypothetical protein